MKKKLTLLLLLIIPFFAYSETVYVDGLKYNTNPSTKTASLTGYKGEEKPTGELTIPSAITVNNVEYSVTSIGSCAFSNCSGFTGNLTIPNSVISIDKEAFYGCSGFTGNLTIGNSVTSIGEYAFDDCSGFTGNLTIPNSVTSIGGRAFEKCSGLTGKLTIPNSVTSIGGKAFIGCSGFTGNLTIPNSVTSIGDGAFAYCYSIENFIIENNTPCTLLGNKYTTDAFPANKFIYVPVGALEAYKTAENWSEYTYIKEIGTDIELNVTLAAPNTLLAEVIKASSHPTKVNRLTIKGELGVDDWALLKSNFTMLYYLDLSQTTNTEIPREAFVRRSLLQTIIISNSVTTIGYSAFKGCSGLIGELTIPNSVTSIGDGAFSVCIGFTGNLTVPNSVTSIGSSAFYYCSGFTGNLTIGNSVTSIGDGAFRDCSGFTGNLTIGNSVTSIGEYAFYECSGFTGNLTIGNSVTSIGNLAFSDCSGFTGNLTIPNSVTSIDGGAFRNCSGFTGNLTIGNSVTYIGGDAFEKCSGFTGELTIGSSVTGIGYSAFKGCSEFSKINCNPITPPSCGSDCFSVDTETCVLAVPTGTLMSYFMAPVWGKFINIVEDSSLAVEDNLVDAARVVAIGGKLIVSDAEDGVAVKVYDLNGVAVADGVVTDGAAQIELPAAKGIYIAIVGNQSYKVVR